MRKNKFYIAATITVVLIAAVVQTSFGQIKYNSSDAALVSSQAILGSWSLIVTSDTFPVPFRGLVTFSEGGGVVASGQGDVLLQAPPGVPPVATAAHGAWRRTANRDYLFTFRQIFYNADGSYAGGAKIRNSVTLDSLGNTMSGELIVQYYDANDVVVFTGTGNFTGARIAAEPLDP